MASPDLGTATLLTFGTSTGLDALKVENLSINGIERVSVPTSHFETVGGMTFIPGDLYDPGEIVATVQFDEPLISATPPYSQAAETLKIQFGGVAGEFFECSAFLTSMEIETPLEDKIMSTLTFKCSGDISWPAT